MIVKDKLKTEIDRLDNRYLELLYKIVCQFPHVSEKTHEEVQGQDIAALFQEIANAGGLDIRDPLKWQQEIRKDRPLPFREA